MAQVFSTQLPLSIGHASRDELKTGSTVIIPDHSSPASYFVMGGAPGSRETDLLNPDETVDVVDAIVLSGGSAFGLAAADGAQCRLAEQGKGFAVGPATIPIVPAAICFDLFSGSRASAIPSKEHPLGKPTPYWQFGYDAVDAASKETALGTVGAGRGATTSDLKGGFGAARSIHDTGLILEAYVVVNAVGTTIASSNGAFLAHSFEIREEFGGRKPVGFNTPYPLSTKLHATGRTNTTIGCIATNAKLDKASLRRLSMCAHTGLARGIWPSHTPLDGDLVFALSVGDREVTDPLLFTELCSLAASTFSRAIAIGVYNASPAEGDPHPTWQEKYNSSSG